jgi:hypothetical protein
MNIKFNSFIPLFIGVAALAVAALIQNAHALPSASDINYKTMQLGASDGSCVVATHTATNLNLPIDISKQRDIALFYQFTAITDAVNTCSAVLSPSLDGTVAGMDTSKTVTMVATANTTTAVVISTNLNNAVPWGGIGGYRFLVLRYLTNATADYVTNTFTVPYKHGLAGAP